MSRPAPCRPARRLGRPAEPVAVASIAAALIAIAVLAGGCFVVDDGTVAVPTPERQDTVLLPPTPRSDVGADDAATTDARIDPVETPTPFEAPPTPQPSPLRCLSQRELIAQLLLPLVVQQELAAAAGLAANGELGGIGLLGSPDQGLAGALAELQNTSRIRVLVASDEEGGTVQRLAELLGPMPSAATAATTSSPAEVEAAWLEYGSRVKELGIDVVFGPVVDVGGGPGIGTRAFSADAPTVTHYANAVASGLTEAGVLPVFKHFPGHGRASGDSHLGLPVTPHLDELRAVDLVPYVELLDAGAASGVIGTPAVMVGHLSVPGLTGDLPASLSTEAVNGLLRGQLGFDGLVFTDALNMGAIVGTYGVADATERALVAGADIVILGSLADVAPVLDHLVSRAEVDVGLAALLDDRARRVLEAKGELAVCGESG